MKVCPAEHYAKRDSKGERSRCCKDPKQETVPEQSGIPIGRNQTGICGPVNSPVDRDAGNQHRDERQNPAYDQQSEGRCKRYMARSHRASISERPNFLSTVEVPASSELPRR